MSDTIIAVEQLGKCYRIDHQVERARYKTLRETLTRKASGLFKGWHSRNGSSGAARPAREEFWALKDVSIDVKQGEVLGIIGRNGAGKSTLLKILSRITEPTRGRVRIRGRVASLLEVGTGFHPELTGRENVFLNGAILGMSKVEIQRKFDEIVAFAGVEKFLDTPVKRYSSGMYVRLAFAVAAHLEPEILVVDEVLSVGDAEFQKKCLGKMQDVSGHGRTVLFVSHNMAAVKALCQHGLLLESGQLVAEGPVSMVTDKYAELHAEVTAARWERPRDGALSGVYFTRATIEVSGHQPELRLVCAAELYCRTECRSFIALDISDNQGSVIMQAIPTTTQFVGGSKGTYSVEIVVELPPLIPGRYTVDLWMGPHYTVTADYLRRVLAFEISDGPLPDRVMPYSSFHGFMVPRSSYRCSLTRADRHSMNCCASEFGGKQR